jgi:hypothetical protein
MNLATTTAAEHSTFGRQEIMSLTSPEIILLAPGGTTTCLSCTCCTCI